MNREAHCVSTRPAVRRPGGARYPAGFTLIELLIVIAILGTLVAVFAPQLIGATDTANEKATEATMLRLDRACQDFNRAHGWFPTDNLKSLSAEEYKPNWKATDNGQNTGIESLVAFISQSRSDGAEFSDLGSKITNTDKDEHGAELPLLGRRKDRVEIADAWGTPFAYFAKFGMQKTQSIVGADDEIPMPVTAKRREDGTYYGADKYQILSAGKDKTFGTGDDLVWPKN